MEFVTYSCWEQLPKSANILFSKGEKQSIFFSRLWFEKLVTTELIGHENLLFACVIDNDNMLAVLPLITSNDTTWRVLSHYYTSLFTLLLTDDNQQNIMTCLALGLASLPFEQLLFKPIADDDKNMEMFQQVMERCGFNYRSNLVFFNWLHYLQGQSFDEYMATRPSKVINTINRKARKLEREQGFDIKLFTNNDLRKAVDDFHTVWKASWKANERSRDLIDNIFKNLSKPNWLRLAILYIDQKPVAAQIWFVVHEKASIFRLVYDENWKRYSPGSILTRYLMKQVIDIDKVKEIDFLTGNDTYKQDWMTKRQKRWSVTFIKQDKPKGKLTRVLNLLANSFKSH